MSQYPALRISKEGSQATGQHRGQQCIPSLPESQVALKIGQANLIPSVGSDGKGVW